MQLSLQRFAGGGLGKHSQEASRRSKLNESLRPKFRVSSLCLSRVVDSQILDRRGAENTEQLEQTRQ